MTQFFKLTVQHLDLTGPDDDEAEAAAQQGRIDGAGDGAAGEYQACFEFSRGGGTVSHAPVLPTCECRMRWTPCGVF